MGYTGVRLEVTGMPASTSTDKERKFVGELKTFMRSLLDALYREEENGDIYVKDREYLGSHRPVMQGVVYLPTVCRMGQDKQAKIAADFRKIVYKHFGSRAIVDCVVFCEAEFQIP